MKGWGCMTSIDKNLTDSLLKTKTFEFAKENAYIHHVHCGFEKRAQKPKNFEVENNMNTYTLSKNIMLQILPMKT